VRRICIVVGSRANYASIKSVLSAIDKHPDLELQLVAAASALLDRYGAVVDLIEADGFVPAARVHMLVEGETPATMAKSTGLGLMELPTVFERLRPDFVLAVGDRFETMATTLAAAYMNIPIAHTMGGEISGTIDESIRHAVTKFAHIHFPASAAAGERIIRLGENPDNVHVVGCPRIDLVTEILGKSPGVLPQGLFGDGVGDIIDIEQPFIIVSQHPVTTEYGDAEAQIMETLHAASEVSLPIIGLWPNADAGADDLARGIRKWREQGLSNNMHFFKNLATESYIRLMDRAACLVGNSSSGIREGAFIGTPVVNIGSRQTGRERGENVIDVGYDRNAIRDAIRKQVAIEKFPRNTLYGEGNAGSQIAETILKADVSLQKRISF